MSSNITETLRVRQGRFFKILALGLVLGLAGCATYQQEKADLRQGRGESQRQIDAQNRLKDEQARSVSLKEEQLMAEAELGELKAELQAVNGNQKRQEAKIANARSGARISETEAQRLQNKLSRLTSDFNGKAIDLELSRQNGSKAEIAQKTQELEALKRQLNAVNSEIEILTS